MLVDGTFYAPASFFLMHLITQQRFVQYKVSDKNNIIKSSKLHASIYSMSWKQWRSHGQARARPIGHVHRNQIDIL